MSAREIDRRGLFRTGALVAAGTLASGGSAARAQGDRQSQDKGRRTPQPSDRSPAVLGAMVSAALSLRFDYFAADTVKRAKLRVLDLVGCAIGGKRGEGARALIDLSAKSGGAPEATLLGAQTRVPAREAAMVNAIVARMYDFEVMTVAERGWSGKKNGELLRAAEAEFDVFVTMDRGIEYQQNLASRALGVVLISARSNRRNEVGPAIPAVNSAIRSLQPGELKIAAP